MQTYAQKHEGILAVIDRHVRLSLATPFIVAAFFVLLKYVGSDDLRRIVDFLTFSPGK
jgi:hypothetical protein